MSEINYFEILQATLGALNVEEAAHFRPGGFDISTDVFSSPQAVTQALHDFASAHTLLGGWVQTTGAVLAHPEYFAAGASDEVVLCAELAAERMSLHVRQSTSGWLVTRFEVRQTSAQNAELIETVQYMARAGFGPLIYEVAWTQERDDFGNKRFIQSASRLAGGVR